MAEQKRSTRKKTSRNRLTSTMINVFFKTLRNKIHANKLTDNDLKKLNGCVSECIRNRKFKKKRIISPIMEIIDKGVANNKSRDKIVSDILSKYTPSSKQGKLIPSPSKDKKISEILSKYQNSRGKKTKKKRKRRRKRRRKTRKKLFWFF
jgi:hypothetical protein